MTHDRTRLGVSLGLATLGVAALVFLVLSSQITMAIMPVIGMGELFMSIGEFRGNNAVVYPQFGQSVADPSDPNSPPTHGLTDTARCQQRPALVFKLDGATVENYKMFKDIELPFLDRFMTIRLNQTDGARLEGSKIKMYTSHLQIGTLTMYNVRLLEGRGGTPPGASTDPIRDWGPYSDEFKLVADKTDSRTNWDMRARDVQLWASALTADGVEFIPGSSGTIDIDVTYNTTSELESRYDSEGFLDPFGKDRESYFRCVPSDGPPSHDEYAVDANYEFQSWEDPEAATGTWTGNGDVQFTTDWAVEIGYDPTPGANYSATIGDDNSTLTSGTFDFSSEVNKEGGLPLFYAVNQSRSNNWNDPEETDSLAVQYKTSDGRWVTFDRLAGGDAGRVYYRSAWIPDKAFHGSGQIRFKTDSSPSGAYDYWHIDHIFVG